MAAVLELIVTTITPENFTLANNSTNSTHEQEPVIIHPLSVNFTHLFRPTAQTIKHEYELTCP